MKKMDVLITGVGGQGVILASDIYGETALSSGYDVKKTDTLGMAQRGGSVISHVRIGPRVWSPLIKEGEVDLILSFEKLEAARWSHYLRPGGTAIINNLEQPPQSVNLGKEDYPGHAVIAGALQRRTGNIYFIDGLRLAAETGNPRTMNILMLGCMSMMTPLDEDAWKDNICRRLPENLQQVNLAAFERGRKEIQAAGVRSAVG
jgi:indolepyruvate ferredoxin oxidoreductase beta subunit